MPEATQQIGSCGVILGYAPTALQYFSVMGGDYPPTEASATHRRIRRNTIVAPTAPSPAPAAPAASATV